MASWLTNYPRSAILPRVVNEDAGSSAGNAVSVGSSSTTSSGNISVGNDVTNLTAGAVIVVGSNTSVLPTDLQSVYILGEGTTSFDLGTTHAYQNVIISGGGYAWSGSSAGVTLGNNVLIGEGITLKNGTYAAGFVLGNVIVGQGCSTDGVANQVIGYGNNARGKWNTLVGNSVNVATTGGQCYGAVGIGQSVTISNAADLAICIGQNTAATTTKAICLGLGATDAGAGGVAGGLNVTVGNAVTVAAAGASDAYLNVSVNGVVYKLLLHT